jgi:capsular exopolysaccharide synthesis family protein
VSEFPAPPAFLQPASQEEPSLDLRGYWRTVVSHAWTVALVTAAVTVGTALWTLRQPKIYRASATVAVEFTTPKVLDGMHEVVELGSVSAWANRGYMDLQLAILKSGEVSLLIGQRLASDPTFVPISQRDAAMKWLPGYVRGVLLPVVERDGRIVRIAVEDLDPDRAARVANTAAEVFVERNLSQKLEATVGAADWLVTQVNDLQGKLETSEVALQKFKEQQDILSATFEDRQSMNSSEMIALSSALTELRLKRVEVEVRRRQMTKAMQDEAEGVFGLDAVPQVYRNAAVATRREEVQKLKLEREQLLSRYGELHPKVQGMERELEASRGELAREYKLVMEVENREFQQLEEQEREYLAAFERARQRAFEVNRNEIYYNRLRRQQTNNERLYELVLKRQKETDLASANRFNNMRILDRAVVANAPIRPNATRNASMGLLIGLILGIALAFLLEFLDNTVKTPQDVEQKLGMVFLGLLPTIRTKSEPTRAEGKDGPERNTSRDLHVHLFPKSAVAECCRAIRTNLLFMTPDTPLRSLVVTSPGPKEGKTTSAISLAIAMAQSGSRTLIIDTDLRRPRVHKTFGLQNQGGVTTVLVGDSDLKDVIKSTEVPGLDVLPSGPIPPNPSELLHTAKFQEMLAKLREQYDRIILDSPPVGAVADALILSSYVEGVVVCFRAMKTNKELAARTRRALADVNARVLGVVVNDIDLERRPGYYAYYQSRYGYVYGEGEEEADRAAA